MKRLPLPPLFKHSKQEYTRLLTEEGLFRISPPEIFRDATILADGIGDADESIPRRTIFETINVAGDEVRQLRTYPQIIGMGDEKIEGSVSITNCTYRGTNFSEPCLVWCLSERSDALSDYPSCAEVLRPWEVLDGVTQLLGARSLRISHRLEPRIARVHYSDEHIARPTSVNDPQQHPELWKRTKYSDQQEWRMIWWVLNADCKPINMTLPRELFNRVR